MSNDLISRNALLEGVNYYYTHTPNDSPEHYAYGVVLKEIREQPTAFDKEKVIGELRNEIHLTVYDPMISGRYIKKERAIEIVEKGGIE